MTSFITSSKQSGFSTAQKGSRTKSGSAQGGVNFIGFGAKGKVSGGQTSTTELNESYVTDTQQKEEERVKVTQAIVAEYMYIPIKTFRLMEGGLVLTKYAYYRLRKFTVVSFLVVGLFIVVVGVFLTFRNAASIFLIVSLEKICANKDNNGEPITDDAAKEAMKRKKAYEFLCNFGSHIPFGELTSIHCPYS